MNFPNLNTCNIAIIGMGYVGLPLAFEFAKNSNCYLTGNHLNRKIIGFDINPKRVNQLNNGIDSTKEFSKQQLSNIKNLSITNKEEALEEAEVFIVTVPTPIDKSNKPDLKSITEASKLIGRVIKRKSNNSVNGDSKKPIIIYESTVFPGVTEDHCRPIIDEESGLKFNKDYFLGYSPERINPGDNSKNISSIIKLTSGSNESSSQWIDKLYGSIIKAGTFNVKSIKVAEAAKVIENTQRDLNIALVNEFAIIFKLLKIDTLDVLEAAGTKWNFLPFKPGLVGGHCIGVDPYYLTFKSEIMGYAPQVVLAGRRINNFMPEWIVRQIIIEMTKKKILISSAKALILGITFKENCSDIRNSKIFNIVEELKNYSIESTIVDPLVDLNDFPEKNKYQIHNKLDFKKEYEIIICAVAHNSFVNLSLEEWEILKSNSKIIFDLKGIVPRIIDSLRI